MANTPTLVTNGQKAQHILANVNNYCAEVVLEKLVSWCLCVIFCHCQGTLNTVSLC